MKIIKIFFKTTAFLILFSTLNPFSNVVAEDDLGLCPDTFDQGYVTTGFVDCNEDSSRRTTLEQAEQDRIEFEAICNAAPRAEVTNSDVKFDGSRYYADVTCTVTRIVPAGTTLCPIDSQEYQRAFDNVICMYYGSAAATVAEGQVELTAQTTQCNTAGGTVLQSMLEMDFVLDEIPYYVAQSACILDSAATDVIECPFGFEEDDRDENLLECEFDDRTLETLAEAQALTQTMISICTDTTAGLGSVLSSQTGMTTIPSFFSEVFCQISIPRYGEFSDESTVRACDTSCTEDIQQARICLNGGEIGGPGCTGISTQIVVRSCNTGPDPEGLCPLAISTTTVIPLLLLDDEEED